MAIERTLSIVKPDAVAKGVTGEILRRFEEAGLYGGPSGRRVPIYRLAGEAAERLPWHNPETLRKRIRETMRYRAQVCR